MLIANIFMCKLKTIHCLDFWGASFEPKGVKDHLAVPLVAPM